VTVGFVDIVGINDQSKQPPLNSDGQQFHQYQQNKQPLNSEGQQFHQ
jgi:hypothetical protein